MRPARRHAVRPLRGSHRPHAGQLPVHEQLLAARRSAGPARTLDLLLRARALSGEQAHAAGFVAELCDDDALDRTVQDVVTPLLGNAPLTMWAAKQAVARLRRATLPDDDDIVRRVFGSQDFRDGVRGFLDKERVPWSGR